MRRTTSWGAQEHIDNGIAVGLFVIGCMERRDVISLLQEAESQEGEIVGDGCGVESPGGCEDVVLGAVGEKLKLPDSSRYIWRVAT